MAAVAAAFSELSAQSAEDRSRPLPVTAPNLHNRTHPYQDRVQDVLVCGWDAGGIRFCETGEKTQHSYGQGLYGVSKALIEFCRFSAARKGAYVDANGNDPYPRRLLKDLDAVKVERWEVVEPAPKSCN